MSVLDRIPVPFRHVDSVAAGVEDVYERVRLKAFEYYRDRGAVEGFDLDDWLRAESALIFRPDVSMRQFEEDVVFEIHLPEIDPVDLTLQVAADEILVTTPPDEEGWQVFRVLHLPQPIDVHSIDAELVDGILLITATVEGQETATAVA